MIKKVILGAISLLIGSAVSAQDTDAGHKDIYIDGQLVDFGSSKTIHSTWTLDGDSQIGFSIKEGEIELWTVEDDDIVATWDEFYQDAVDFNQKCKGCRYTCGENFSSVSRTGQFVKGTYINAGGEIIRTDEEYMKIEISTNLASKTITTKAPVISVMRFFTTTQDNVSFLNSDSSSSWLRGFYYQVSSAKTKLYSLGFNGFIDFNKLSTNEKEDGDDSHDGFFAIGTNSVTFILENPNI